MASPKKNYIYNTLYQILILLVPLITTPYLSRTIGSEGVGVYSYNATITVYFTMFIILGLEHYGSRTIATVRDNQEELSRNFLGMFIMQLSFGIIVSGAYSVYVAAFSDAKLVSLIFAINVLSVALDCTWFLNGMEAFKAIAIRTTTVKILTTVSIFIFVRSADDVNIYILIMCLSNLLNQLFVWPFILKKIKFVKISIHDVLKHVKPNMLLFLTTVSVALYKTLDKFMLGLYDPTKAEVGYYELSERIISIPNLLVASLGTVMLPHITTIKDNEERVKKVIKVCFIFSAIVSTSICFGIMGVSKEFVPIFYGEGFDTCITLYLILLPCSIFMSFANVVRMLFLLPNKMDKHVFFSGIVGLVVDVVLNLILIWKIGCIGAAIGTLVAEFVIFIIQTYFARKKLPIASYLLHYSFFVIVGAIMFSAIFIPTFYSAITSIVLRMVIKIIIGFVFFSGMLILYLFIIKKKDNDLFKELLINRKNQ